MPVAMALLRDVQNLCPKDVLNFILDLIKYNDNRKNKVQKNEYVLVTPDCPVFFRYAYNTDGSQSVIPPDVSSP